MGPYELESPADQCDVKWHRSGAARTIEVNRYLIAKVLDKQLVLRKPEPRRSDHVPAKIYMTLDAVRLNRTDGALVRIITPVVTSDADAERDAVNFVQTIFPLLGHYLPS